MVVQAKKRVEPYFLGHGVDRFVFFFRSNTIKRCRNNQKMWGVSKKDRNLTITVGGP
jgi:hypothetical protein